MNLLDKTPNQLPKFRTKNSVETNDQSRGVYSNNEGIRFKITMVKSGLRDYSDAYILVKGRIRITGAGADAAVRQGDARDNGVIFINCAPFINCKADINRNR